MDLIEAYKWFALAAAQHYEPAVNVLYMFTQAMSPAQIAEARRRVAAHQKKLSAPSQS